MSLLLGIAIIQKSFLFTLVSMEENTSLDEILVKYCGIVFLSEVPLKTSMAVPLALESIIKSNPHNEVNAQSESGVPLAVRFTEYAEESFIS